MAADHNSDGPNDPFALMRGWVGEWEKLVNRHGAEWLAKPEVAKAMQKVTSAKIQAEAARDEAMAKWLAAANMPSKADFDALAERFTGIEAALARIEAHQRYPEGATRAKPAPRRTRKPPGANQSA
ncbi:MAG TPA: hypothetical protein VM055_04275 [Novosphingobium sp.]|nr:hypothetical protein [Novosphingobium sp.]